MPKSTSSGNQNLPSLASHSLATRERAGDAPSRVLRAREVVEARERREGKGKKEAIRERRSKGRLSRVELAVMSEGSRRSENVK